MDQQAQANECGLPRIDSRQDSACERIESNDTGFCEHIVAGKLARWVQIESMFKFRSKIFRVILECCIGCSVEFVTNSRDEFIKLN